MRLGKIFYVSPEGLKPAGFALDYQDLALATNTWGSRLMLSNIFTAADILIASYSVEIRAYALVAAD